MIRCSFPGCPLETRARGLCTGHYAQHLRGKDLTPLRGQGEPMEPITLRLAPHTRSRVAENPRGARAALDRWAAKRR